MNRLRIPILVDLAGLALVVALWLAALAAPVQSSQLRFGLLSGAYCGDTLPGGTPDADSGCHPCCLPGMLHADTVAPDTPARMHWFVGVQQVVQIGPSDSVDPTVPIRAPPVFAA